MRLSHPGIFGILLLAVSSSLAITTNTPGSEESTTPLDPSLEIESTTFREIIPKVKKIEKPPKLQKSEITELQPNQERFRQALSQEQQQNCLSQLLCGVRPANPPSKKTNYVNDLAYVVKEFFDIIDVGESGADDEEDEEKNNDEKTKQKPKGESKAKSPYYKITTVNNKPKIVQKDDTGDDEQDDDPIRNTEEAMDKEVEFKYSGIKKITLEELVDDIRLRPEDIVVYKNRKGRMMMTERASQDLRRKMRQIKLETDDKKKLSIAADIANKLRSPRQCRQLSLNSNAVASTPAACPLTREVIKYLQTNIANGAEKHKNETALATLNYAAQQGFLLVEGDKGQVHAVDHNPLVANKYVATDLKNPSVPNRFQPAPKPVPTSVKEVEEKTTDNEDESEKEKEEDEDGEGDGDDDGGDEEEEAEADTEGDVEQDDEGDGNDQEDEEHDDEEQEDSGANEQEEEEEEEDEEEEQRKRRTTAPPKVPAATEEYKKRVKTFKKPLPPLPSGTIRVYGVPQSSFDSDFHRVSATIGTSNVHLFDQDDYDSVLMSGYSDDILGPAKSSYQDKKDIVAQKVIPVHGRTNTKTHHHKKRRPAPPTSDSVEDEQADEESSDDEPAPEESQQIIIKTSAQKQPAFAPPYPYGGGGPQEYFHSNNERQTYDPRPLQMRPRPAEYNRRNEFGRPARFYPMPFQNYPRY